MLLQFILAADTFAPPPTVGVHAGGGGVPAPPPRTLRLIQGPGPRRRSAQLGVLWEVRGAGAVAGLQLRGGQEPPGVAPPGIAEEEGKASRCKPVTPIKYNQSLGVNPLSLCDTHFHAHHAQR